MPQVKVSDTKGLYQVTGSGFVLEDNQIQPASETLEPQLVDIVVAQANAPAAGAEWDGYYFLLYSSDTEHVIWFEVDTSGISAPSVTRNRAASGQVFTKIAIAAAANNNTIASAIQSAVDGLDDFEAYVTSATLEIVGATPYANVADASSGTLSAELSTCDQTVTGSGNGTVALDLDVQISILRASHATAAQAAGDSNVDRALQQVTGYGYTLDDGTFVGQRKTIIFPMSNTNAIFLSVNDLAHIDMAGAETDEVYSTAAKLSVLQLMWTGGEWVNMSEAAALNITGQIAS